MGRRHFFLSVLAIFFGLLPTFAHAIEITQCSPVEAKSITLIYSLKGNFAKDPYDQALAKVDSDITALLEKSGVKLIEPAVVSFTLYTHENAEAMTTTCQTPPVVAAGDYRIDLRNSYMIGVSEGVSALLKAMVEKGYLLNVASTIRQVCK